MNALAPQGRSRYARNNGRLSPWVDPASVLAECIDILEPPSRISVVEAAEQYRVMAEDTHQGLWDRTKVPYMVEPMNMTQSRRYVGLVFVGPARAGKSDSLVLNRILYLMTCVPGRVMLVNMDQKSAGHYSQAEIDRMIRNCPNLSDKRERGAGANTLYQKLFKGGGALELAWPTPAAFANKTLRDVILTDRDRMPEDIGGDGDPFTLGKKRGTIAGSMAMCIEESSPSKPIKQRDWTPKTIHEAPPCDGVIADYNLGTRARWYFTCAQCSHEFEADFHHLRCSDEGEIFARAQTAHLVCPQNGCVMEVTEKKGLNLAGRWLHESKCGTKAVPIGDDDIRESDTLSYWLKGVAAAFQSWPKLMLEYLQAEEHFVITGSEKKLQVFNNTSMGRPHLPKAIEGAAHLTVDALKNKAVHRPLGVAPAGVRFITAQIDVQGSSFEVQIDGWGAGLERWLIDRYSVAMPPPGAPGAFGDDGQPRRSIRPAEYQEDWAALDGVIEKVYPVEGSDYGLMPVAATIDRNGPPGATDKAYAFWRLKKRQRMAHRWFLVTGMSRPDAERIEHAAPQRANKKFKKAARDVPVLKINTMLLKDEVAASLLRDDPGPGFYHLPTTLEHRYFEEFAAEQRTDKRWEMKVAGTRNECFDLAYYGKALVSQLRADTANMDAPNFPQFWHGAQNSFAVPLTTQPLNLGEDGQASSPLHPSPQPAAAAPRISRAMRMAQLARARTGKT